MKACDDYREPYRGEGCNGKSCSELDKQGEPIKHFFFVTLHPILCKVAISE